MQGTYAKLYPIILIFFYPTFVTTSKIPEEEQRIHSNRRNELGETLEKK
jgi:hypothetical protein